MLAARGVWLCLYFSHPDVQMLDGGLSKWTAENLPTETQSTIYKPSNLTTPIDPSIIIGFEELNANIQEYKPNLIWIETPSNPLLQSVDIKTICKQAKQVKALVAVDNTFLSPALQNPLKLGADIVIHSTTKYINGHSDVVGGAVIAKKKETFDK